MRDASLGETGIIPSFKTMIEVLREKGFRIGPLRDTLEGDERPGVMLRHDVDHRLDNALRFAELEAKLGLKASYFLLPPGDYNKSANYYGRLIFGHNWRSRAVKSAIRQLASMGHEIGMHNDLVQMSFRTGRSPGELLNDELGWLRNAGADVVGTAAHGSEFARRNDFVNYEIFEGLVRSGKEKGRAVVAKGRSISLHTLNMKDFGLLYEAYYLPRRISLSDSGGALRLLAPGGTNLGEAELAGCFLETFMAAAEKYRDKPASILFHPEWWQFGIAEEAGLFAGGEGRGEVRMLQESAKDSADL